MHSTNSIIIHELRLQKLLKYFEELNKKNKESNNKITIVMVI